MPAADTLAVLAPRAQPSPGSIARRASRHSTERRRSPMGQGGGTACCELGKLAAAMASGSCDRRGAPRPAQPPCTPPVATLLTKWSEAVPA
eukprot:scaffold78982_cov26-Tisochrysis_lutea.AAC.5